MNETQQEKLKRRSGERLVWVQSRGGNIFWSTNTNIEFDVSRTINVDTREIYWKVSFKIIGAHSGWLEDYSTEQGGKLAAEEFLLRWEEE